MFQTCTVLKSNILSYVLVIVEDDTECLMVLMRYPSGVDVKKVVKSALLMRRPQVQFRANMNLFFIYSLL